MYTENLRKLIRFLMLYEIPKNVKLNYFLFIRIKLISIFKIPFLFDEVNIY